MGEEVNENRTYPDSIVRVRKGRCESTYLCGDVGDGCRSDFRHAMDAGVAGTGCFGLFIDRTR